MPMTLVKTSSKVNMNTLPVLAKEKIASAQLPALYVKARSALKACHNLDEIKEMSDKHSAIAHYAKQVKDDSLLYYAQRIKLRASERLGELLKEFETPEEYKKAREEARISPVVASNAVKVASVPKRVLDTMIDGGKKPLTINRIRDFVSAAINPWERSMRYTSLSDRELELKPDAPTQALRILEHMADFIVDLHACQFNCRGKKFTPTQLGTTITIPYDVSNFRERMDEIIEFLDEMEAAIPECDPATKMVTL